MRVPIFLIALAAAACSPSPREEDTANQAPPLVNEAELLALPGNASNAIGDEALLADFRRATIGDCLVGLPAGASDGAEARRICECAIDRWIGRRGALEMAESTDNFDPQLRQCLAELAPGARLPDAPPEAPAEANAASSGRR